MIIVFWVLRPIGTAGPNLYLKGYFVCLLGHLQNDYHTQFI